jgi:outer membrane receptor protein involved in Fe transport
MGLLTGAATLFLAGAAAAQVSTTTPGDQVQEVVVTSSRIERNGFAAPTPTTVVGQQFIQERAIVNVGDLMRTVPAFKASTSPAAGGIGNNGQYLADLRGLGPGRTLVLIDRGRMPATGGTGTTDLNTIPTIMISSSDVVTGGASAAYGSDAVAGVVNFMVDDRLNGMRGRVQYGETRYSDAQDFFAGAAAGTTFAGGRGHIIVGGEYDKNNGTGFYNIRRGWGREFWATGNYPNRPAGTPFTLILPNSNLYGSASWGGVIQTAGPLQGLAFVPTANGGVTTVPFARGIGNLTTSFDAFSDAAMAANRANGIINPNAQQLRPPVKRYNFMSKATFNVTDNITAFIEPLYSNVESNGFILVRRDGAGAGAALTIAADNPYLRQALTPSQLAAVPAAGIALGYAGGYFGPNQRNLVDELIRVQAGLKGDLGGSWKWDASYIFGQTKLDTAITNDFNQANFRNALDAVSLNGQIVCRNAAARSSGCVPINILGQPTVSPAAQSYILGTATGETRTRLDDLNGNIQGEPFSTWAGPVSVAVGGEYRRESYKANADPISVQSGGWLTAAGSYLPRTKQTVKEAYGETVVPLAKDLSFAKSLNFNGAVRITNYSTSGSVTTWKVGATWEPTEGLLFRTTRSRDIRAANLIELFAPQTPSLPLPADPRPGIPRPTNAPAFITGGNPDLKPEKATTQTVGVSFSPSFIRNLRFSVDYYDININDAITSTGTAGVLANCFVGGLYTGNSWCSLITFANNDPVNGQITGIKGVNANVANVKTRGIDFQVAYRQRLEDLSAGLRGAVSLNFLATRALYSWTSTDVSNLFPNGINRVGQDFGGGVPKWVLNTSFIYDLDRFQLNGNVRFISAGKQNKGQFGPDEAGYDPTLTTSINNNHVPSVTYLDLGVKYALGKAKQWELFANVDNVFDKDPPPPMNGTAYYDLMGRTYKAGVRFTY